MPTAISDPFSGMALLHGISLSIPHLISPSISRLMYMSRSLYPSLESHRVGLGGNILRCLLSHGIFPPFFPLRVACKNPSQSSQDRWPKQTNICGTPGRQSFSKFLHQSYCTRLKNAFIYMHMLFCTTVHLVTRPKIPPPLSRDRCSNTPVALCFLWYCRLSLLDPHFCL